MLYLIGGIGRTGKSSLARRLIATKPMMWTSTDLITSILQETNPQLGIKHNSILDQKHRVFTPYLKALCVAQKHYEADSLIEGDAIAPDFVTQLSALDIEARSCFLGFSTAVLLSAAYTLLLVAASIIWFSKSDITA